MCSLAVLTSVLVGCSDNRPTTTEPATQTVTVPATTTMVARRPKKPQPRFRYSDDDVIRLVGLRFVPGSGTGGSGDFPRWINKDDCEIDNIVRGRRSVASAAADPDRYPHTFVTNSARDVGLALTAGSRVAERERCYRSLRADLRNVK